VGRLFNFCILENRVGRSFDVHMKIWSLFDFCILENRVGGHLISAFFKTKCRIHLISAFFKRKCGVHLISAFLKESVKFV
jgi:hypothetical protein